MSLDHTINDNDAINFAAQAATGAEGVVGGQAPLVSVTMTGSADRLLSIHFATVSGASATSPNDFGFASGTLSWAAGATGSRTAPVTIVDDNLAEGPETFTVLISSPPAGTSIATGTATATITDKDVVTMTIAGVSAGESSGFAVLTVTLSGPSTTAISTSYTTATGSASALDFTVVGAATPLVLPRA